MLPGLALGQKCSHKSDPETCFNELRRVVFGER